jgi:hypothetical protein
MSSSTSLIASTIVSTFPSTLTTTYIYNNSASDQPNQSSDSGLTTAYIGLIIALIGLAGTFLVQYNIKKVKLCCVNLECTKKDSVDLEACEHKVPVPVPEHKVQVPVPEHKVPEHKVPVPEHKVPVPEHIIPLLDLDIISITFPDNEPPTVRFSQESNMVESTF